MTRVLAGICIVGMIALGCAQPSLLAETHGDAFRSNRDGMVANPEPMGAGVEGLDPRSAERVLENYDKGQKAQEHDRAKTRMKDGIVIGEFE